MAHVQQHTRHISDSSLLVSCLRHSGVLPATPVTQTRHSSLPVSYAASSMTEERILLAEAQQEDCPAIILTAPPMEENTIRSDDILGQGKEKEHDTDNTNGTGLIVLSMTRGRSLRSRATGNQHRCLHDALHIGVGAGAGLAGLEEGEFCNTGISPRNSQSYRSFTPPIRPRTSSLTGTQLLSISEDLTSSPDLTLTTPPNHLGVHRNFSTSSEPALIPSASTPKVTRQRLSPHRSLGSREDFEKLRFYNPIRHSTESSLSCLGLSIAEKRTISRGIEQDEARAEERAEERRKAVNVRRFVGMVRSASDCHDGEQVSEMSLTPGRYRGRKWDYMFNQNDLDEGRWPIRDEPVDPVEVQAMGMLVPLMEINPNEPGKDGDSVASPMKTLPVRENLEGSEHIGPTGTVKRKPSTTGTGDPKRPSLMFRLTGAHVIPQDAHTHIEAQTPQEVVGPSSHESPKKQKSLRHKISSTILRYMGHTRSPTDTTSSSESAMTGDASLVSIPEAHIIRRSRSKIWKSRHQGERLNHSPPSMHQTGEGIKILHPLNEHYESASRRRVAMLRQKRHNRAVVNLLLGVIRKQKSKISVPSEVVQIETDAVLADMEGIWNGYSWESTKFREAGKHVTPAIGEGGLALDRDFPSPGKTLRKVKKSYSSLRPADGRFTILPQKANISWTNFLHEFAGTLGNVRESGVRPISDKYRGSADSLLLAAKTARQSSSLGRSMLSKSTECLTTTEMEEYEREEAEYVCLGGEGEGEDDSESEDGMEYGLIKDVCAHEEERNKSDEDGDGDNAGDGEPENGHSISGDEGSSADDDEDSKLRALLNQVGRPYAGYSSGGALRRYNSRRQEGKKQETTFTSFSHLGKCSERAGNEGKALGNLSQNNDNFRNGNLTVQENDETGVTTIKSTFVARNSSGNGIIGLKEEVDENTKPREVAEDYSKGYTLEDHIPGYGAVDGQWRIEPEVMRFLVH